MKGFKYVGIYDQREMCNVDHPESWVCECFGRLV